MRNNVAMDSFKANRSVWRSVSPPKGLGFEPWLSGAVGKELPGKQKKNTGVWLLTGQSEAAINDLFCGAKAHKSHLKTAP